MKYANCRAMENRLRGVVIRKLKIIQIFKFPLRNYLADFVFRFFYEMKDL